MFLTFKLITCFIDGFTSKMKSQSIPYLLSGSERLYWILDLEGEMHSMWDLWRSVLQECKGNGFFEVGRGKEEFFGRVQKILISLWGSCPLPVSTSRERLVGGRISSSTQKVLRACSLVLHITPLNKTNVKFSMQVVKVFHNVNCLKGS